MQSQLDTVDRIVAPRVFFPLFVLLTAAISAWFANQNLPDPDESAALCAAVKILNGEVFYRGIDAYPFPGSSYFLALWMSLFGEHMTAVRLAAGRLREPVPA